MNKVILKTMLALLPALPMSAAAQDSTLAPLQRGVIAAIALPSYNESRLRAARADGKHALRTTVSDQERFYSTNFSYSLNASPLTNPPAATVTSPDGNYIISIAACGGGSINTCFVATATPLGAQANDVCGTLTLSSNGTRTASGGSLEDCWQR